MIKNKENAPIIIELIGMGAKKYGGLEKFIVEECKQLKEKGIGLLVVFSVEPICKSYIADLENLGAEWVVLPFTSNLSYYKCIRQMIKSRNVLAIHKNFGQKNIWALIAAKQLGVKYRISTEHCFPDMSRIGAIGYYNLELPFCTEKLCVSKTTAEAFLHAPLIYKNKITTEYLGVSDFFFDKIEMQRKYGLDHNVVNIANVAYHNPIKGVDVLLKAVKILVDRYKADNFRIIQIGGGQNAKQTEDLHALEQQLGISKYVNWMGVTDYVPEILSACDVYTQPSRSEGISLSIMEASLASLPTAASRVGGIVESVVDGKTGILCNTEDPDALADILYKLITDSGLRKSMGDNARMHALAYFDLRRNVSKLLKHYGVDKI